MAKQNIAYLVGRQTACIDRLERLIANTIPENRIGLIQEAISDLREITEKIFEKDLEYFKNGER